MKQKKKIHKKVAKIFNHRGFIAISMFSLGLLLPLTMPAFNSDFMKNMTNMPPMPPTHQGCTTQTSADGTTTTQCINQVNQTNENTNIITSSGSANPVTMNLPKLPKFCKYVTGAQGITISCATPLPSNMPISIPPMKPMQVPLPTLPSNCQYQTGSGTPQIHCTAISGTPHVTFVPMKRIENPFMGKNTNEISITPRPSATSITHNPIVSFLGSIAKFFFGFGK